MRTIEWNNDFKACRAAADKKEFDKALAEKIGKGMFNAYKQQQQEPEPYGPSMVSCMYFDNYSNTYLKEISDSEAKILFLGASDIFWRLIASIDTSLGEIETTVDEIDTTFDSIQGFR